MRISDWSSDVCSSDLSVARDFGAVAADEITSWQRAAMHMWLPVDPATGVHPQDDGFMDKPPFPQGARDVSGAPLLVKYHPLVLFRHRLCKQGDVVQAHRSEEHTSELQSLMRISYSVFCLKKQTYSHILETILSVLSRT